MFGCGEIAAEIFDGADFHLTAALPGVGAYMWGEQDAVVISQRPAVGLLDEGIEPCTTLPSGIERRDQCGFVAERTARITSSSSVQHNGSGASCACRSNLSSSSKHRASALNAFSTRSCTEKLNVGSAAAAALCASSSRCRQKGDHPQHAAAASKLEICEKAERSSSHDSSIHAVTEEPAGASSRRRKRLKEPASD